MPRFDEGNPPSSAVLAAISEASGPSYRDADGDDVLALLERDGHDVEGFTDLMFRLRDDDYVTWTRDGDGTFLMIRLASRGREAVEAWPAAGGVSAADFQSLIRALSEQADDPALLDDEKQRLTLARDGLKGLSTATAIAFLNAWVQIRLGAVGA